MIKRVKHLLILIITTTLILISSILVRIYFQTGKLPMAMAEENITHNFNNNLIAKNHDYFDQQILNSNRQFAFNLFQQTLKTNNQDNLLISPTSVSLALSLLYNGASGETQQQMSKALALQELDLTEVNKAYQNLLTILQAQTDINLSIANSIWLREGFAIKPSFLENNQQYYQTQVTELDFGQPEAKNIINNWVKESTQGKIDNMIDSIKREDVLFLINAIYFQGKWQSQFNSDLTKTQPFNSANGETINYPLMTQSGNFAYYQTDDFQLINLPYGESGGISMYVLLPQEKISLDTVLTQVNSQTWQEWQNKLEKTQGLIALPKFSLEYDIELNNILTDLGMKNAFTDQADFSNLTESKVKVSQVKHKTFIDVNEEGTEASAATSIGVSITSLPINQPFQMIVNRPFLYIIQDNQTDTILFMGTVNNLQLKNLVE